MKLKRKRLLSILLSLALMLGMLSGMSLTAYADEQTVVWEGEQAISDVNTVSIDKDKFSNIQLGDKLVVQFKDAAGELLQLKSNDAFLPGTDCGRLVFPDQSTYEAYATQAMIRSLKTYGLQVCGKDYTALKVWYEAGKDSMDENTVWSGYFWMDSWSTLELAATSFDGVDWDSVEAIRFISEAGRSDWTLNIRTSWEEDGKVADQSSMTWKDNYFELSLDEIDMAAKLENKDRLYIQGDKDGGEAFNFTQVQLVTVNEAVSEPENIIISPASGDIAEALAAAEEGKTVGDITINLTEGVTYTISNTIVVPASLTINGNGAIIDAGNLNAPMIALANIENPTQWTELNIAVSGLYVNGLKKQMFYSACKNYLCKTFTVDNCVVEVVADVITFDFTKGSVAESFVISNSTFYAPTATTKSLYSSQGGQKLTEYNGDTTQSFKLTHNTFFNLAPTKNFFVHRQNNQKWLSYEAKGNVFANCGKRGQVIIGLNGSGISANPTWDIDGNLFNYDGADTSATETTGDNNEPVKNSVAGVVTFVAPASGNFNGTLELSGGATLPEKLGDPRFTLSSHTHNFTYSASGATITATCTADGCDLPESSAGAGDHVATLTISASGGTYDGTTAYGATVTDPNGIQGEAKVQYQKKTGESYGTATETAPTDAGDYKASITVDGATASVEYTIAQADPTANAPTGLTATYGQTLVDVSLEGKNPGGNTPGTWAWADSTKSVGNVVTPAATFKAIFTPDSSNYKTVENVEVTVTVSKAENPATVTGTASVTAGGNIVDLAGNVTKNSATGDVSYAISGEANGCSLNGSVLTSGNTAGTVTVNVTVAADANYNALAATPITVTINEKQTQTITADDVTVTYGDTGKSIAATSDGDGNLSYAVKSGDAVTVDETTGALTIVKAGSAVITVTAAETATYAQATKDVNITVNQVNSSGEVTAVSGLVYDGTEKALVDSKVHGGILMYRLGTDGEWTEEIPEAADFGTYTVYYYIKGDGNHKDNGSETEPMGSVDVTIKCPYSNEWVDGKWYNKDGSQTYKPLGSWKKDGKDWMYADSSGWYAKNRWQKIDFKWYFFDKEGHMLKDAYQKDASGKIWYIGKNGAWDEKAAVIGWKQDSKGWWFGLYGKEYLKSTWKMINGNWYYFKADGYVAQNEFVNSWWCNKNGVQSDPVKYSWHKTSKGWWYGVSGGWYAKNATYTIDGKSYTFDKMGYQK